MKWAARAALALVLALLAACVTVRAPVAGPTAPDAAYRHAAPEPLEDAPRAPEPSVTVAELDNGMPLWIAVRPGSELVDVRYVSRAAGEANPKFPLGASSLTAEVLLQGATLPDGTMIREPRVGGRALQPSTSASHTAIGVSLLSHGASAALSVLGSVVRSPVIDAEALRRGQRRSIEHIRNSSLSVGSVINPMLARRLWGEGHPLAHDLPALEQAIRSLKREQIAAFHAATYRPEASALVVVGDVDPQQVLALANRSFGDWSPPASPAESGATLATIEPEELTIDAVSGGWKELMIEVAFPAPGLRGRDYHAFGVALTALTGGLGSRAMLSLRHHDAQLYAIHASRQTYSDAGVARLSFRAPAERAPAVLAELLREIERLQADPLSPEELELARRTYAFGLRASTTASLASQLESLFAAGHSPDWLDRAAEEVAGLSAQHVRAAAAQYLSSKPAVAVVGDYRGTNSRLEKLGKLEEYSVQLPGQERHYGR